MFSASPQTITNNDLTIGQPCGYAINGSRVLVNASRIANNRELGNLSGTLAVQLWALKQPYAGGKMDGILTASNAIGEIAGQYEVTNFQSDLLFTQPAAGTWFLCLALAEWNGSDYTVVDAVNFDLPYQVSWQPQVVAKDADKVIAVDFGKAEKSEKAAEAEQAEKAETAKAEKVEKASAEKVEKAKVAKAKTIEKAKAITEKPQAKAVAAEKPKATAAAPVAGVSINDASIDEIARIKGLSKKIAKAIVDARPYKAVDELIRVKGLGKKMLDKIISEVKL